MEILKLNLKKEVFEDIKGIGLNYVTFDTTPFYFSKFTTSKHNTVEDVTNDKSLFKKFDTVDFMCSGETISCKFGGVLLVTDDNDNPVFRLSFENPYYDSNDGENGVSVDEVVDTTTETEHENVVEDVVEDETPEVETLKPAGTLHMILDLPSTNVFRVASHLVRVGRNGSVSANNQTINLPCRNEQIHTFNLEKTEIEFKTINELKDILDNYTKTGYLFICLDEDTKLSTNKLTIWLKKVTRYDLIRWM